jgi:transcriptional regulator of acetoin/glycerol metabolism
MPFVLQSRLLRFLDQRTVRAVGSSIEEEVDVQVVAATNSPLETAVTEGKFRSDLFYRLQGMEITIPPLRQRSDFVLIVEGILENVSAGYSISTEALAMLRRHPWPGNLRELKHVLLRIVIMAESSAIEAKDVQSVLPAHDATVEAGQDELRTGRSKLILEAYHRCHGNIVQTAHQLAVSRNTVYRELRRQGIF